MHAHKYTHIHTLSQWDYSSSAFIDLLWSACFAENYCIVEVAFNPEVLHRAGKNPQGKEEIHLLALNFTQKQHKLSLSRHFTVMNDKLKGTVQDMKCRLTSLHQSKSRTLNQDNPQIKPGK